VSERMSPSFWSFSIGVDGVDVTPIVGVGVAMFVLATLHVIELFKEIISPIVSTYIGKVLSDEQFVLSTFSVRVGTDACEGTVPLKTQDNSF